jgi:hypothetical protein
MTETGEPRGGGYAVGGGDEQGAKPESSNAEEAPDRGEEHSEFGHATDKAAADGTDKLNPLEGPARGSDKSDSGSGGQGDR